MAECEEIKYIIGNPDYANITAKVRINNAILLTGEEDRSPRRQTYRRPRGSGVMWISEVRKGTNLVGLCYGALRPRSNKSIRDITDTRVRKNLSGISKSQRSIRYTSKHMDIPVSVDRPPFLYAA